MREARNQRRSHAHRYRRQNSALAEGVNGEWRRREQYETEPKTKELLSDGYGSPKTRVGYKALVPATPQYVRYIMKMIEDREAAYKDFVDRTEEIGKMAEDTEEK